jgi:hypothetical protein
MKSMELRFNVAGQPVLSDAVKSEILQYYAAVPHSRLKALW